MEKEQYHTCPTDFPLSHHIKLGTFQINCKLWEWDSGTIVELPFQWNSKNKKKKNKNDLYHKHTGIFIIVIINFFNLKKKS